MLNQRKRNAALQGIRHDERLSNAMEKLPSEAKKLTTSGVTDVATLGKDVQELSRRLQIVEDSLSEAERRINYLETRLDNWMWYDYKG